MRFIRNMSTIMTKTSSVYTAAADYTIPTKTHPLPSIECIRPPLTRKRLPAVWMRSGTSKGLFLHRRDLPASPHLWAPILLSAMGSSRQSKSKSGNQIDGVGGASTTTSKVAVVERSTRPDVDVEYTFVQVAPDQPRLDMTGNCGNIASGVGPFALDEGIVRAVPGQSEIDIRVFNTNTGQTIVETVQIAADGLFREEGNYSIPGVEGTSSRVRVAFMNPGGSMTGCIFPSGAKQEILTVSSRTLGPIHVRVSLVDAANPFVLVDAASLHLEGHDEHHPIPSWPPDPNDSTFLSLVEDIRREGAVRFGLAADTQAAGLVRGTPKIAILSRAAAGECDDDLDGDIQVLAFTMGKPHPSLQLTGAVCLGAATAIHGTVAWELAHAGEIDGPSKHGMNWITEPVPVGIRHPAGVIHAETSLIMDGKGGVDVDRVAVSRTARRLFEGSVLYRVETDSCEVEL